jgi:hypothetical protein
VTTLAVAQTGAGEIRGWGYFSYAILYNKGLFKGLNVYTNALFSCIHISIEDVSKILEKLSGVNFPHKNKGKSSAVVELQPPSAPDLSPLHFYLWGHLKNPSVFS